MKIRKKKTVMEDQRRACQLIGDWRSQNEENISGTQAIIKDNIK